MTTSPSDRARVLSIDPSCRGFGFAVFEGSRTLLDWGVARVWGKGGHAFLARIDAMIDRYQPVVIVLGRRRSRRGVRAERQVLLIGNLASSRRIPVRFVSQEAVRETFESTGTTKHQIAMALVRPFPELEMHLPRKRQRWTSEDERMNIFDAVAIVVACAGSEPVNVRALLVSPALPDAAPDQASRTRPHEPA
jgi:hypothetical protein